MFIMLDAIDGGGKGTVIDAWKEYITAQGNPLFDLKSYWEQNNKYPDIHELRSYDFIFTAEPTSIGIGKTIREELIRQGVYYPPEAIAQAYALDRLILYEKIILPCLAQDKFIIQDRGFSTSLAYQNAQNKELTFEKLLSLPGNALALKYRPDYLILLTTEPEEAMRRLSARGGKKDNAIFENLDFQRKTAATFKSPGYQEIFTHAGTRIIYLSTMGEIDIIKQKATDLLAQIINKKI